MNLKRCFKLDTRSHSFQSMPEKERILVEEGFELTKKYFADRAKADRIETFSSVLDGIVKDVEPSRNEKFMEKLVKYCLEYSGESFGDDFDISCIKNPMLNKKMAFREKFNAVLAQIITPVVPARILLMLLTFRGAIRHVFKLSQMTYSL